MLDIAGLLTAPRLWLGAVAGMLVGFGAAYLADWVLGARVPAELLALLVALGTIVGMILGATSGKEENR